ncbi:MAG: hypothetical protein QNL68_08205 [Akkermansiaceae bacterium]
MGKVQRFQPRQSTTATNAAKISVNLPVLLAGGDFKHGQHLSFDKDNNYPFANLYLSMLHRLGIDTDKFATSNGTMRGLEIA